MGEIKMGIQNFEKMLSTLSAVSFGTERYYNLQEAFAQLTEIGEGRIQIGSAIITPFYVDSNARQELYAFELTLVDGLERSSIEDYLRRRTGYADLSKVDSSVISRLKHCYLETEGDDHSLSGNALAQYCIYLLNSEDVRKDINDQLNPFNPAKLYFSYYSVTQKRFLEERGTILPSW